MADLVKNDIVDSKLIFSIGEGEDEMPFLLKGLNPPSNV